MKNNNVKIRMKYYIVFLITLIIQSCSNQKVENDWTKDNLKGKVLSYSEFSYKAEERFGSIVKGARKRNHNMKTDVQKKYDENGKTLKTVWYNSDGSVKNMDTYKYDNGNMIEKSWYKSEDLIEGKYTYKYEKVNIIEKSWYKSGGRLENKYTFKYDEKGNMIERNSYSLSTGLNYKYTFKYDEKGSVIEKNWYNPDGSLDEKNSKKYKGLLTAFIIFFT